MAYIHQRDMSLEEKDLHIEFLKKNGDLFAWTYSEMSSLEPVVATHRLAIEPDRRLLKQTPRHMHQDVLERVEVEFDKLVIAGFI